MVRNARALKEVCEQLDRWLLVTSGSEGRFVEAHEINSMLHLARMMVQAALMREESRGVHFREDFPETNHLEWTCRIAFGPDQKPRKEPCPKMPIMPS